MTDLSPILLLLGLGLLLVVVIVALIGFLSGFKKEIKCTAIFLGLLILALMVFGDPSTILNMSGEPLKGMLPGIPESAKSMWDCILAYAKTLVANGSELFADGTDSYAFLYALVSGVVRGASILLGVLGMLILTWLGIGIYRIVAAIVNHNKAKKAKIQNDGQENEASEPTKDLPEAVLVSETEDSSEAVVVTTDAQALAPKKKTKQRGWGALLATVRACFVITLIFAPISGICTMLSEVSPETQDLIEEFIGGSSQKTSQSDSTVDQVLDMVKQYEDSTLGKVIESSRYFFKDSFSTKLFDSMFRVKTETKRFSLRSELSTIIQAANALEGNVHESNGNINLDDLTQQNVNNALDELKDSNLIQEAIPVGIEYAYYCVNLGDESLRQLLFNASQEAAFLAVRKVNWDKNIGSILDAVKDVYRLGIVDDLLKGKELDYLNLDTETLAQIVDHLTDSDAVNKLLNVVVITGINLKKVTDITGPLSKAPDLENLSWKQDLLQLVDAYNEVKALGIESFENFDVVEFLNGALAEDAKVNSLTTILKDLIDLQLVDKVAIPLGFGALENNDKVIDLAGDQMDKIQALQYSDLNKDVKVYIEAMLEAVELFKDDKGNVDLKGKIDPFDLDPEVLDKFLNKAFEAETFAPILSIGTNIALNLEEVKKNFGSYEVIINTDNVNWPTDFTQLVNIYREFLKLNVKDAESLNMDFVKSIFASDEKLTTVDGILNRLANLDLFVNVLANASDAFVNNMLSEKYPELKDIVRLNNLTKEEWTKDFKNILLAGKEVYSVSKFDFALDKIDFTNSAPFQAAIEDILTLNLLGDDSIKNALVKGALAQFDVLSRDVTDDLDFSEVKWLDGEINELGFLQRVIDELCTITQYDGFDITFKNLDYNKLLENDNFIESLVNSLEECVDSNLVNVLLPDTLDKYVVPKLEDIDDEDSTLKHIIDGLESEELINEVIKLVDVVKSTVKLNVLHMKDEGIGAIKWENTDDMRAIINGILDSKFIEGNEGRIVRIILKATKIFEDIEKGAFDNIDFEREQQLLIKTIDEFEIVLQDENFLQVDENGKIIINIDFYTADTTLEAFMNVLHTLFGEYKLGQVYQEKGSYLVQKLLPEAYDKYMSKAIPEELAEVIEIIGIGDLTEEELISDVRHVIYILDEAIDMQLQTYLQDNDYAFGECIENVNNILDALFDTHIIHGNESELAAYGLNYVAKLANTNMHFEASEFANISWNEEVANIKDVLLKFVTFTNENNISTVNRIISFIENGEYKSKTFLTQENADMLFDILDSAANLQTIEYSLPVLLEFGLVKLEESGVDVTFLGDDMTPELLAEDLKNLAKALRIAVKDLDICTLYQNDFEGKLPEVEPLLELLDTVSTLNILAKKGSKVVDFALDKVFEKMQPNDYLKREYFVTTGFDYLAEYEVLREAIALVYTFFDANNITEIGQVKQLINEKWYTDPVLLTEFNALLADDILSVALNSDFLATNIHAIATKAVFVEQVRRYIDLEVLSTLTVDELVSDLRVLTDVVRDAVKFGAIEYVQTEDIKHIDYQLLSQMISRFGDMFIFSKTGDTLAYNLLEFGLRQVNIPTAVPEDVFNGTDWTVEFALLGDTIVGLGNVLSTINLDSVKDIMLFISNKDYNNPAIITEEVGNLAVEALRPLENSRLVSAIAVHGVEYAIPLAEKQNIDISFMSHVLTAREMQNDIHYILDILQDAISFGAMDYLRTGDFINGFDAEIARNIVANIDHLNLLNCNSSKWAKLAIDFAFDKIELYSIKVTLDELETINWHEENIMLQDLVYNLVDLLANENLNSIADIKSFIEDKQYMDVNVANDRAVMNLENALLALTRSQLVELKGIEFFNFGIDKLANSNIDVRFLKNSVTINELLSDVETLVSVIDEAVKFGVADIVLGGNLDKIDDTHLVKAISHLDNLYLINNNFADWGMTLIDLAEQKTAIDFNLTKADFENINHTHENFILQAIASEVVDLIHNLGLVSSTDVYNFIQNKDNFTSLSTFDADIYTPLSNILLEASTSKVAEVVLPDVVGYGLLYLYHQGIETYYLRDLTGEEICSDIHTLGLVMKDLKDSHIPHMILDTVYDFNSVDQDKLSKVVTRLAGLELVAHATPELVSSVLNYACMKANVDIHFTESDFADIDLANDIPLLGSLVFDVFKVFDALNIESINGIQAFIDAKEYNNYDFYSDSLFEVCKAPYDKVTYLTLVQGILPKALDYAKANVKDIDLSFVTGHTGKEIASDLRNIYVAAVQVYDSGVVEYAFNKDITKLDINYLAAASRTLEHVNMLVKHGADWSSLLVNNTLAKQISEFKVNSGEFGFIDFVSDLENLAYFFENLSTLVHEEMNMDSLEEIKSFIDNKDYLTDIYSQSLIDALVYTLYSVVDVETLTVLLPNALNYATTKVDQIDISFLKNSLSRLELVNDANKAIEIFDTLATGGILDIVTTKDMVFNFPSYDKAISLLDDINILNVFSPFWAAIATNVFAEQIKYTGRLDYMDYLNVTDWSKENTILRNAVKKIGEYLDHENITMYSELDQFIQAKDYSVADYYRDDTRVNLIADLLDIASKSNVVDTMMMFGTRYAVSYGNTKGWDLSFIEIDKSLYSEDLANLANAARSAALADVADFASGLDISHANFDELGNIVREVLTLNTIAHDNARESLLTLAAKEAGLHEELIEWASEPIDWNKEIDSIVSLLTDAHKFLDEVDVHNMDGIKALDVNELVKINEHTNPLLEVVRDLSATLSDMRLVEAFMMPISVRFFGSDEMDGVLDLHDIYEHGTYFTADLAKLSEAVDGIISLDLHAIKNLNAPIPYANTAAVEKILTNILGTMYLDNPGRIETLLVKYVKDYDLSTIDDEFIDLASDATKLISMYKELLTFFLNENWPVITYNDIKDARFIIRDFASEEFRVSLAKALQLFQSTSLFSETNGAICVAILPAFESKLGEYYTALDLANVTSLEFSHDINVLFDMIYNVLDVDLVGVIDGKYFIDSLEQALLVFVDQFQTLIIPQGKLNALTHVVAEKLDGKIIAGSTFIHREFDIDSIDFDHDLPLLKPIISDIYSLARTHSIVTLDEAKALFNEKTALDILKVAGTMDGVSKLYDDALALSLIETNALNIYKVFAQDKINHSLAELTRVYADNLEFHSDLVVISNLLHEAISFGAEAILNEQAINYDQGPLVSSFLANVSTLRYLDVMLEDLISFLDTKLADIDLSSLKREDFDLENDFNVLGAIYNELIPVLMKEQFPVKNINDLNPIKISRNDLNALIYDSQLVFANVVEKAALIKSSPKLAKIGYSYGLPKINDATIKEIVELFDILGSDNEQLRSDIVTLANILRDVETLDILNYVLYKNNVTVTSVPTLEALVDHVYMLNLFVNNYKPVVEYATSKALNMTIDATDVDYLVGNKVVKGLVAEAMELLTTHNMNNIVSVKDGLKDPKQFVKDLVDKPSLPLISKMIKEATESTYVMYHGLAIVSEKMPSTGHASLDEILDLAKYDNETFVEDLLILSDVVNELSFGNIYDCYFNHDLVIDYTDPHTVSIVELALTTNGMRLYAQDLVDIADRKITQVDLSGFEAANVDFAGEAKLIAETYRQVMKALTENATFNILTVTDIKNLLNGNGFDHSFVRDYETDQKLVAAFEVLDGTTISVELAKIGYDTVNKSSMPGHSYIDRASLTSAELSSDYENILIALRHALDGIFNNGKFSIPTGKNGSIENPTAYANALEYAYNLHVFDDNKPAIVKAILDKLGITVDNTFENIAWDIELGVAKDLIVNGANILVDLGNLDMQAARSYLKDLLPKLKADYNEAIELLKAKQYKSAINRGLATIKDILRNTESLDFVLSLESLTKSDLINLVAIPAYEQKVYSKLSGFNQLLGDIHTYRPELFDTDLDLVASIARNLYDSGLGKFLTRREMPTDACVPYLEDILRDMASLEFLEIKKQDFGKITAKIVSKFNFGSLQQYVDKIDFASFDFASVSFKADADNYASLAGDAYVLLSEWNELNFHAVKILGNTIAIKSVANMYGIMLNTQFGNALGTKAISFLSDIAPKFHASIDPSRSDIILDNSLTGFNALINLGVFSNDGIDFTDYANAKTIHDVILDSITLPSKLVKYMNAVLNNIDAYGIIPFDWNKVNARTEINVIKALLNTKIKVSSVSEFHNASVKQQIYDLADKLTDSTILEQIGLPFANGTYRMLTSKVGRVDLVTTGTFKEIVLANVNSFCDIYASAYEVGIIKGTVDKENYKGLYELATYVAANKLVTDNVGPAIEMAVMKFADYTFNESEQAIIDSMDMAKTLTDVAEVLRKLALTKDMYPFHFDSEFIKNVDAVLGVADALDTLSGTDFVKAYAKALLTYVSKTGSKVLPAELAAYIQDRLADPTYTHIEASLDYPVILDFLRDSAKGKLYANNIEFATWNFNSVRDMIDDLFVLNLVKGHEEEFMDIMIDLLPFAKDYYDPATMVVADWHVELTAVVNALEALVADGITNVDNVDPNLLSDNTLELCSKSVIISNVISKEVNKQIPEYIEGEITAEQIQAVTDWHTENLAIKALLNISSDIKTVEANHLANINNSVLFGNMFRTYATDQINSELTTRGYLHRVALSDIEALNTEALWQNELDALQNISNGIDSVVSGVILESIADSNIFAPVMVEEINKRVSDAGYTDVFTLEQINAITDWNKEASAINVLIDVSHSTDLSTVSAIDLDVLNNSVLFGNMFRTYATEQINTKLQEYGYTHRTTALDIMAINSLASWEKELNAIKAVYNGLDGFVTGLKLELIANSTFLAPVMVEEINNRVASMGYTATYTQADIEAITDWNKEADAINAIMNVSENMNLETVSASDLHNVNSSALLAKVFREAVVTKMNEKLAEYGKVLTVADIASIDTVEKWQIELDAINSVKAGIIDAVVLYSVSRSALFSDVVVSKANEKLTELGLNTYYTVTAEDISAINTEEAWINELSLLDDIVDAKDGLLNPAQLNQLVIDAQSSVIAKKVLAQVLA